MSPCTVALWDKAGGAGNSGGGTKAAEIAVGEASKNGDVYGAKINVYSIYR
jgi:hypothetical protein